MKLKLLTVRFPSLVLHFVDGDRCPVAIDNSGDLFDSTQAVALRSGTEQESGLTTAGWGSPAGLFRWQRRRSLVSA